MLKIIILIHFITVNTFAEFVKYDNYTLYKIYPKTEQQIQLLQELMKNDKSFDFWNEPLPNVNFVNIMSSSEQRNKLEQFIEGNNLKSEIVIADIQNAIENQKVANFARNSQRSMQWDAYYTLDGINNWYDDLVQSYPEKLTKIVVGTSYEGRNISGIKLSHGSGKKAVFIEGGIHAREWISPATVNYIAYQLITSDNEEIKAAAEEFDWYIFPVTNPDGFVYTHTTNRLWRKNRRPVGTEYGVDLNRNWDSHWLHLGASDDPSSNTYAGTSAFSEPETLNVANFIRSIGDTIDLYLSFHSYSQYLLIPYGNSTGFYGNYFDALDIGRRAMGALSVRYGTQYITGTVAGVIYEATGTSIDWVKDEINVPLVYCYELRDTGSYGFLLPTEEILPNAEETLDSVLELIHQAKRFGYMNSAGIRIEVTLASLAIAIFNLILALFV